MAESAPAPPLPWSERLFASAPVPPLVVGLGVAAAVAALFAGVELAWGDMRLFLRGEAAQWKVEEYGFAVVLALLIGYLPAAYAYAVAGSRRTLDALRPALRCSPSEFAELRERAGRFEPRSLRRAGLLGVVVALTVPFWADLSLSSYSLRGYHSAAAMHRVLLPVVGWLAGRFVHATLADSSWLARIGRELVRVDLLDLSPLAPFTRHGLRNALLAMGLLSILSLLLADWGARPGLPGIVSGGLLIVLVVAVAGLLLPVRGVHAAIRAAKRSELAWCGEQIRRRREALAAGGQEPASGGLHELVSYRGLVDSVREWPFDASTLSRFALYLAIPLGSWLGGAMVERLVDALLS